MYLGCVSTTADYAHAAYSLTSHRRVSRPPRRDEEEETKIRRGAGRRPATWWETPPIAHITSRRCTQHAQVLR
jgi:hypothetical protein